jgi:hypothetical protein
MEKFFRNIGNNQIGQQISGNENISIDFPLFAGGW